MAIVLPLLGKIVLDVIVAIGQAEAALRHLESIEAAVLGIGSDFSSEESADSALVKIAEQFKHGFGRFEPVNSFEVVSNRFKPKLLQPVGVHGGNEEVPHLPPWRARRGGLVSGSRLQDLPNQSPIAFLQFLKAAPAR